MRPENLAVAMCPTGKREEIRFAPGTLCRVTADGRTPADKRLRFYFACLESVCRRRSARPSSGERKRRPGPPHHLAGKPNRSVHHDRHRDLFFFFKILQEKLVLGRSKFTFSNLWSGCPKAKNLDWWFTRETHTKNFCQNCCCIF